MIQNHEKLGQKIIKSADNEAAHPIIKNIVSTRSAGADHRPSNPPHRI